MKRLDDIVIKVLSLGFGLAIGIVLIAKVCFESSYDTMYADMDRICQIRTGYVMPGTEDLEFNNVSGAVAYGFKSEVPGVVEATRVTGLFENPRFLDEENNVIEGHIMLVDSCFFNIFDRPVLAGNPQRTLATAYSAVVVRSIAEKLGGVDECLGKIICNEDAPDSKFLVESVVEDFPENSSFNNFEILLSLETYPKASTENWLGNDRYNGWVKLDKGVDPESLTDAIRRMQEAHQPLDELERSGTRLWYFLRPFGEAHTDDPMTRAVIVLLSGVAALLLVISLLNYILVVISSMVKRSREVGVRKCYGATNAAIYWLLAREAVAHIVLSLLLSAAIICAGKGIIRNLLGVDFATLLVQQSIAAVAAVVAAILAVSTVVPAQLYMRVPVHAALKNFTDRSRRWKLGLLGVQVFINVFLLAVMFVIGGQYRLLMNDNPGYETENILHFRLNPGNKERSLRIYEALRQMPEVEDAAAAYNLPFHYINGNNIVDDEGNSLFNAADNYEATAEFYDLLGIGFVDGRAPQSADECAVDEAFVEKINEFFDWSDGAVGKSIMITGHGGGKFTISGVHKNILTGNRLRSDDRPSIRFYSDLHDSNSYMPHMLVKVSHIDGDVIRKISDTVAAMQDGITADVGVYGQSLRSNYSVVARMRNTLLTGIAFSMLIALMGLIGFVRNETLRRSKEMAIRKINGATMHDILRLFMVSILRLSAVVSVVACAAAYWAAYSGLQEFSVKVALSPWFFIGGVLPVLATEIAVIIFGCWRIASSNPVDSLKNE